MNPNHPAKPTSQQVPEVEPLSAEQCRNYSEYFIKGFPVDKIIAWIKALEAIASGHHVVISATELSALRAREERLRELVVMMEKDTEGATPTLADLAIIYYRKLIESILNEGKT